MAPTLILAPVTFATDSLMPPIFIREDETILKFMAIMATSKAKMKTKIKNFLVFIED
ncbi:MAG: hypothetical protein WC980_09490 [Candidatus Brocadiia bacterium]